MVETSYNMVFGIIGLLIISVFVGGGHVACMGDERGCIGSWWGNRREGDHWGDLGVDGWIILGWISRR